MDEPDRERLVRLEERVAAAAQALALDRAEIARRLEGLNHEAQRIATAASISVTRELFDQQVATTDRRLAALERSSITVQAHDQVIERIQVIEAWKNRATGAAVILAAVAGAIGAAVAKVLSG